MSRVVLLDSTPLGLLTQRTGILLADECRKWCHSLLNAGVLVLVPEISDYEVRRELLRANKAAGVARLNAFIESAPSRYLPLTTAAFRLAARLWADSRRVGRPTSADPALDADVLIAAQGKLLNNVDLIVATENVRHIGAFVPADSWRNIQP